MVLILVLILVLIQYHTDLSVPTRITGAVDDEIASARRAIQREAAADMKAERLAEVDQLNGDAKLAFYQWPGCRSGNRELLVLVRSVLHVRSRAVSCLLVGKAVSGPRPISCWEHAKSQGRYACYCKQRLRQLWMISGCVAADAPGEPDAAPGAAPAGARKVSVGCMECWRRRMCGGLCLLVRLPAGSVYGADVVLDIDSSGSLQCPSPLLPRL